MQPRHVPALNNLGALLAESGHPREALAYLEAAAALRPTDATIHHNVAETLRELRQRDRADQRDDLAHHLQPGLGTWAAHLSHKGSSAQA